MESLGLGEGSRVIDLHVSQTLSTALDTADARMTFHQVSTNLLFLPFLVLAAPIHRLRTNMSPTTLTITTNLLRRLQRLKLL